MELEKEHKEQLLDILNGALQRVYAEDQLLVSRKGCERSIGFRLGMYLVEEIKDIEWLQGLDIDLEYNKDGDDPKRTESKPNGAAPDLIIHQRGNNECNALAVEMKGWWSTKKSSWDEDNVKLQELTDQNGKYQYGLGVFVELQKEGWSLTEY